MADDTSPDEQEEPQQNTWLYVAIAIVGGCGCLIIAIPALGLGGVIYHLMGLRDTGIEESPPPVEGQPPEPGEDLQPGQPPPGPSELGPEDRQTASPGKQAALVCALSQFQEYSNGKILEHHDDWRRVAVVMGPSEGEWEYGVWLEWDDEANGYTVTGEGAYDPETGSILDAAPDDSANASETAQPGPEAAKEAALRDSPDWVAKIESHSPDYQRVVVWIGPPESEWVGEVTVEWNEAMAAYEIVDSGEVPVEYGE